MSWSPEHSSGEAAMETGSRKKKGRRATEGPQRATFSTVFDGTFFKTVTGILLVVQVVSCFLGMVLGASWRGSYTGGHVFFLIVIVLTFLCGLLLLAARAIRLDDLMLRNVDWNIVFGFYSVPSALLVLIASCVMVEAAKAVSALKAAGVFGLFAWNALFGMSLLHGRTLLKLMRQNKLPTATATVVPGVETTSPPSDESSDEWSDDYEGGDVAEGDAEAGVTLKQATLRPPSYPGNVEKNSQPSLYPMDLGGSNRASIHKSESPYRSTTESWDP